MARKRFLSPDIWSDAFFVKLSPQERLLFIGMITLADDEGRLRASAPYLKGQIFSKDDFSDKRVEALRDSIARRNRNVKLYRVQGMEYIAFLNWYTYQKPSNPLASRFPPPPRWKGGLKETLRQGVKLRVLKRDGYTCLYCGFSSEKPRKIFVDHVIPISRGGDNDEANLVACCWKCNSKKRDRLPEEVGLPTPEISRESVEAFKARTLKPSRESPCLGSGVGRG